MAKHLAGWTAAVVAAALAVSSVQAGRPAGPLQISQRAPDHGSTTYTVQFTGEETALVKVDGDGEASLRVEVYDQDDNLIGWDSGYHCVVTWTPSRTGEFRIEVTNLGVDCSPLYRLTTN